MQKPLQRMPRVCKNLQAICEKTGKINKIKSGLLDSPSMAFMQKRRAGAKSCQFFLSITGRQNRARASGNKGRTRNKRSMRHKELFPHLLILQPKFIYSQTFTWDNAQSYNNILRMSSPDVKAQIAEESGGCSPRRPSDDHSQFCPKSLQITSRPILEPSGFVRAPFTSWHVRFAKSGSIPPRLAYPSLSTWMTNQSCSHQDPLERALKYMGLRGSVGLKRIPPAQPAAVYGSADTQELCNNVCEWDFSLTFNA